MAFQMPDGWELVVGLEVHVELNTATKMFSASPVDFAGEPNTRVFPLDAGLPGTLPVINGRAVEAAARLGLAINCGVAERCVMHRKNYFYPDLPKGYQISQYDVPLCHDGWLDLDVEDYDDIVRVRIERLHMEEDTGKSTHVGGAGRLHGADASMIDYNRAGIPLLEIVSRPDIHDPAVAMAYVREVQAIVKALGVSDAKLEEGSMRCDANVSVNRVGATEFGTRREIKNVNSIRSVGRAIAYEAFAQIDEIEAGATIVQETRHWDEAKGVTSTLRRKETVADYRYFPDPDLVAIVSVPEWVDGLRASLPELPRVTRDRITAMGVASPQAVSMVGGDEMLGWFDAGVAAGADPRTLANWITGDVVGQLGQAGLTETESGLTGAHLAELVGMVDGGALSTKMAKDVLVGVIESRGAKSPSEVAQERGLEQMSDTGALQAIVDDVIARNPAVVEKIRGGADKAIGALVGQVMGATRGQANPGMVNDLLRAAIDG